MKRFLLTIAAVTIAMFTASGEEKTKTYDFDDISGISAGGTYQVHVTEGKSGKVKVVYDSSIEEYVTLDIKYHSGSLILKREQKKAFKNWSNNTKIHVYLEMDYINQVELSGASYAEFSGKFKADNFELRISGASKMNGLVIDGQTMKAEVSGASKAEFTGNFSGNVELEASGASKLTWKGNAADLEAEISGASNAELSGNVENAEYECSGASRINAQDFIAKTASVELSGASKAEVNATENLYYNISRACKMTYYGDAQLHNRSTDTNVVRGR